MIEGDYETYTWHELRNALQERDYRIKTELRTVHELTLVRTQLIRERDVHQNAARKNAQHYADALRSKNETQIRHTAELSSARKHQEIKLKEQGSQLSFLNEVVRGLRESLADFRSGAAYQLQVQKLANKNKLFTQVLEQLEKAEKTVTDRDRQLRAQNASVEARDRQLKICDDTIKRLDEDLKLHVHEIRTLRDYLNDSRRLRSDDLKTIEELNKKLDTLYKTASSEPFAVGDQVEYRPTTFYPWGKGVITKIDDDGCVSIQDAKTLSVTTLHQRIRKAQEPKKIKVNIGDTTVMISDSKVDRLMDLLREE